MHRHNRINKQRKYFVFSSLEKLRFSRKADIPGWAQLLGLFMAILLLVFLIYLSIRSGRIGQDIIPQLP